MVPSRKLGRKVKPTTVRPGDKLVRPCTQAGLAGAKEVCEYIAAMAHELAELAYSKRLDALAVACDVVREIAEGNVNSEVRHVDWNK